MKRIYLIPVAPRVVHPLSTRPLPPEGAWVESNSYWTRRLADGAVRESSPPTSTATKAQPGDKHGDLIRTDSE